MSPAHGLLIKLVKLRSLLGDWRKNIWIAPVANSAGGAGNQWPYRGTKLALLFAHHNYQGKNGNIPALHNIGTEDKINNHKINSL